MRLSVRLLGVEVLGIDTDPIPAAAGAPGEGDGVEVNRHSGSFEMGFQPSPGWLDKDVPQPPS